MPTLTRDDDVLCLHVGPPSQAKARRPPADNNFLWMPDSECRGSLARGEGWDTSDFAEGKWIPRHRRALRTASGRGIDELNGDPVRDFGGIRRVEPQNYVLKVRPRPNQDSDSPQPAWPPSRGPLLLRAPESRRRNRPSWPLARGGRPRAVFGTGRSAWSAGVRFGGVACHERKDLLWLEEPIGSGLKLLEVSEVADVASGRDGADQ
jgi:hypothetical protein